MIPKDCKRLAAPLRFVVIAAPYPHTFIFLGPGR
jgi:hypothetical protein